MTNAYLPHIKFSLKATTGRNKAERRMLWSFCDPNTTEQKRFFYYILEARLCLRPVSRGQGAGLHPITAAAPCQVSGRAPPVGGGGRVPPVDGHCPAGSSALPYPLILVQAPFEMVLISTYGRVAYLYFCGSGGLGDLRSAYFHIILHNGFWGPYVKKYRLYWETHYLGLFSDEIMKFSKHGLVDA